GVGMASGDETQDFERSDVVVYSMTRSGAESRVAAGAAPALTARARRGRGHRAATGGHTGRLSGIARRIAGLGVGDAGPPAPGEIDFVHGPFAGFDVSTPASLIALRAVHLPRLARLEYDAPVCTPVI